MDSKHRTPDATAYRPNRARRRLVIGGVSAIALVAGSFGAAAMAAQTTERLTTCTLGQLGVTLEDGTAVLGAMRHQLRYTNTSAQPCTLQGYPELDFRSATDTSLGGVNREAAGTLPPAMTLAPGASAFSSFSVMVLAPDACRPADAARLLVHPPVTDPLSATLAVPFHGYVCTAPQTPVAVGPISGEPELPSTPMLGRSAPTP